jgi:hypothetical protein
MCQDCICILPALKGDFRHVKVKKGVGILQAAKKRKKKKKRSSALA